jgi:hypothetical protein
MSSQAVETVSNVQPTPPTERQNRALERLETLKRALQRQLRRKPTAYEKAALDHCATMMLRSEMAAFDPRATSNDIVRLSRAARLARRDFERIALGERHEPVLSEVLRDSR